MEPFQRIKAGKLMWLARKGARVCDPQRAGTVVGAAGHRPALPSFRELLENPEAFLRDPTHFIKSSPVVTITRVQPNLILRRLNYGKLIHRLRDLFRPSRAVRALFASVWLEEAGVRTPRALAAAEARVLRWPKAAYLVTEEIPNARTLAALFASKHKIPSGLPESIARLHDNGLSHRDLKWTNILFDDQLSPCLIDLDGVRRMRRVPDRRAREDLLTLARCFRPYPATLKWSGARFLYRYCAARKQPFKPWASALWKQLQSSS